MIGRHTIKVGYEQYYYRFNENGGDHTGVAWINNGGGSVQNWQNPGDGTTGFPLAELMMGSSHVFQWGNWNISPYGFNEGAYAMDDWKVNRKLTVQMGLRWDHDGPRSPKSFAPGQSSPLMYDINAKNVLTANAGWNWGQVTSTIPGLGALPQPAWLTQGATGRVVLLHTPEYPQKNLYTTDWKNFQPRLGIAYAIDDKTVVHASAGIIDQGLNGLSTDWFSFYYNSITMNQISSTDGQHWISELGPDHGLGTFPSQTAGTNLGYYPAIHNNTGLWFPDLRAGGESRSRWRIDHQSFSESGRLHLGRQRTTASGKELGRDGRLHGSPRNPFADARVGLEPEQHSIAVLLVGTESGSRKYEL